MDVAMMERARQTAVGVDEEGDEKESYETFPVRKKTFDRVAWTIHGNSFCLLLFLFSFLLPFLSLFLIFLHPFGGDFYHQNIQG